MSRLTRYFQFKKKRAGVGKEGWESFKKQLVEKEKESKEREKKLDSWYKRMIHDGEELAEEEMAQYKAAVEERKVYMKWKRETRDQRAGMRAEELEREMEGMNEDERYYFLARRRQEDYERHVRRREKVDWTKEVATDADDKREVSRPNLEPHPVDGFERPRWMFEVERPGPSTNRTQEEQGQNQRKLSEPL